MCGFCNVWVCVCVGFVMCGCICNMCTCIYFVICVVSFTYIYSYLLRLKTQLKLLLLLLLLLLLSKRLFRCWKTHKITTCFLRVAGKTHLSPHFIKGSVSPYIWPLAPFPLLPKLPLWRYLTHKPWHWTVPWAGWNLNLSPPLMWDLPQCYPQIHV